MKCKIEEVGGIRTRWLYEGDGPVFLMIHGVGGSGDMWYKNIDFFAEKYTVVAPDIVGHGFTQAVDFKGEPPQMVAMKHLNALMDHIGADKYCVAGSSYGALLSSLMYFDRPDRVEKAVLIGSGSTFHPSDDQIKTLEGARANGSKAMQNPTWQVCQQRLGNICYDPATVLTETLLVQMTSYAPTRPARCLSGDDRGADGNRRYAPGLRQARADGFAGPDYHRGVMIFARTGS